MERRLGFRYIICWLAAGAMMVSVVALVALVPKFSAVFAELSDEGTTTVLPQITRLVLSLSALAIKWLWLLAIPITLVTLFLFFAPGNLAQPIAMLLLIAGLIFQAFVLVGMLMPMQEIVRSSP